MDQSLNIDKLQEVIDSLKTSLISVDRLDPQVVSVYVVHSKTICTRLQAA